MQYVEIYNEVVKDLLDPAPKLTNLDVREDPRRGTFVAGAATLEVKTREAVRTCTLGLYKISLLPILYGV